MRLRLMATHSISIEPQNRNQKVSLIGIVKLLNKALKKIFFCQSKSAIMDAANLQRKIPNSIFLRQKNSYMLRKYDFSALRGKRSSKILAKRVKVPTQDISFKGCFKTSV